MSKKTPMQELLDKINNEEFHHLDDCKMFIQEYMLEKEKKVIKDAYLKSTAQFANDARMDFPKTAEEYYNETFNTKEK